MNTDYQIVAAGFISPINTDIAEGTEEGEIQRYQATRDSLLKQVELSKVVVEITTKFPSYQSLGEGAWRHQLVERIYKAVVARTTRRIKQLNPGHFSWPPKVAMVHLAWDRLHHNESGKPVFAQRWYIKREHVALLGYSGRLGEESFADLILATWHSGTEDATAFVSDPVDNLRFGLNLKQVGDSCAQPLGGCKGHLAT